jgi:hypothetical protein
MNEDEEKLFPFTLDLKDEDGNVWATISVIPSKDAFKRDILLIDAEEGNSSVRSVTELLNLLEKRNISLEDKKRVIEFLAERLIFLESINCEFKTK